MVVHRTIRHLRTHSKSDRRSYAMICAALIVIIISFFWLASFFSKATAVASSMHTTSPAVQTVSAGSVTF